ncbi:MAG: hypothetical protein K2P94_03500 [Rhodospirillaceae bacterium]|nr:hypothetical protein [Rhodospirillaceae bacterium]
MAQVALRGLLLFAVVFGAIVLLGGVVVALAVAVYLALIDVLPPAPALVAASVVPLAASVAGLLVASKCMQAPARRARPTNETLLAELGNLAGGQFSNLLGTHPRKTAMASLLAGFAVGASPELRRALLNLIKS